MSVFESLEGASGDNPVGFADLGWTFTVYPREIPAVNVASLAGTQTTPWLVDSARTIFTIFTIILLCIMITTGGCGQVFILVCN